MNHQDFRRCSVLLVLNNVEVNCPSLQMCWPASPIKSSLPSGRSVRFSCHCPASRVCNAWCPSSRCSERTEGTELARTSLGRLSAEPSGTKHRNWHKAYCANGCKSIQVSLSQKRCSGTVSRKSRVPFPLTPLNRFSPSYAMLMWIY